MASKYSSRLLFRRSSFQRYGSVPLYVACVTAASSAASVRPKRSSVISRMSRFLSLEASTAASQTIFTSAASFSLLLEKCVARLAKSNFGEQYERNSTLLSRQANERCCKLSARKTRFSRSRNSLRGHASRGSSSLITKFIPLTGTYCRDSNPRFGDLRVSCRCQIDSASDPRLVRTC